MTLQPRSGSTAKIAPPLVKHLEGQEEIPTYLTGDNHGTLDVVGALFALAIVGLGLGRTTGVHGN